MVYWYIVAHCEWLGPNFGQAEYLDMNGYTEGTMGDQKIEDDAEVGDPFLSYGIDTETWAYGQAQMEIGLIGSHRIRINSSGVQIWTAGDVWKDPLTEGGGAEGEWFKTITGITNDVVADVSDDTLTISSANNRLTIVGNSETDTINFTLVEANINHNALANYAANRHFLQSEISITESQISDLNHLTEGEISLANLLEKNHVSLTNKNAEANVKHLTDAQVSALHSIYTLEVHNNTYHDPDYKVDFSENSAFNKDFGTTGTEVCVGNDARLSDARTPTAHVLATTGPHTGTLPWVDLNKTGSNLTDLVTRNHNDLLNINAGDAYEHITQAQKDALHAKQHAMDDATEHTSSDIAILNSSTTKHGFLKKLDNNALSFMNGQGNWSEPAGVGGISEADVFALLHIGAGNSGWLPLPLAATHVANRGIIIQYDYNVGADDPYFIYDIPLPVTIGPKNLYINTLILGINDADADDFVKGVQIYGWSAYDTLDAFYGEGTDRKSPNDYTYDLEDVQIGGVYKKLRLVVQCTTSAVSGDLKIGYCLLEYYYN